MLHAVRGDRAPISKNNWRAIDHYLAVGDTYRVTLQRVVESDDPERGTSARERFYIQDIHVIAADIDLDGEAGLESFTGRFQMQVQHQP